jgi:spore cortex biosynthesis protein YabQ
VSLNNQFLTLGLMIGSGLGLGVLFDVYRVLTGQLNVPRWFISLLDILYGVIAAILVFRVLYYSNHGQLRMFVFLGLIFGIIVYYRWLTDLVTRIVKTMIRIVKWIIDVCIIVPIQAVYKVLMIIFAFFKALTIFFYKLMLQLTYPLRFLIFRSVGWMLRSISWPQWLLREVRRLKNLIQRLFHRF